MHPVFTAVLNVINPAVEGAHVINMGATAVGTGLNAEPDYTIRDASIRT